MESQDKATVNEIPAKEGPNERSTIEFPYSDLDAAVDIVKGVHAVGGTTCDYDQLAAHLSMEAKGGGFRTRVTSAKTFGLLVYERGGRISLTELGRQLIDPQNDRSARAEAFLRVPLFAKVFENFKGSPLPPPAALERAITGYGVGSKVAKNARQVLMRSAQQGGYFELSQDRLAAPPIRGGVMPEKQRNETPEKPSGNGGGGGDLHPLIQGLLMTLPKETGPWPLQDRANWLTMANSIFKMIYPAKDGDVNITIKAERGETAEGIG